MQDVVITSAVRTPIGATGAIRLTTLIHEMVRRHASFGLFTICGSGGLGIAAILERK